MTINLYDRDQPVRVTALFQDEDGNDVDPATVELTVISPSGIERSFTYGGSPDTVTRASTGNYFADVEANEAGDWFYRWTSTGTGAGVQDSQFMVSPTRF